MKNTNNRCVYVDMYIKMVLLRTGDDEIFTRTTWPAI